MRELVNEPWVMSKYKGSFDFAGSSLRDLPAPLRMKTRALH
jgi:hypothetical protein